MEALKNQLVMNVPGLMNSMPGIPQMGHHHTHNNTTEQGDTESSEEQAAIKAMQLKQAMAANQHIIQVPGLISKNKFAEKTDEKY